MKRTHIISSIFALSVLGMSISFATGESPHKMKRDQDKGQPQAQSQEVKEAPKPSDKMGSGKMQEAKETKLAVTVSYVEPENFKTSVVGYGEVYPKYQLSLKSEVSGRITYVNEDLDPGNLLSKGDVVLEVNNTKYKSELSNAELQVAEAKVSLLEEERESEQALLEWRESGLKGKPDSDLVLREPQLKAARLTYQQAQDNYKSIKYDYDNTKITTPFDSFVVDRSVNLGGYIQEGTEVAQIYNNDKFEVEIPISQTKWNNLEESELDRVMLSDKISSKEWEGKVSRVSKNVDTETRQRSIYVSIDNPMEQSLYSGTFVKALIDGKEIEDLWKLPQTAILDKLEDYSTVFSVSKSNELEKLRVQEVYQESGYIYVRPLVEQSEAMVINKPLISYKEGMKVEVLNKKEGTSK